MLAPATDGALQGPLRPPLLTTAASCMAAAGVALVLAGLLGTATPTVLMAPPALSSLSPSANAAVSNESQVSAAMESVLPMSAFWLVAAVIVVNASTLMSPLQCR
jgi:hypothetical protein